MGLEDARPIRRRNRETDQLGSLAVEDNLFAVAGIRLPTHALDVAHDALVAFENAAVDLPQAKHFEAEGQAQECDRWSEPSERLWH